MIRGVAVGCIALCALHSLAQDSDNRDPVVASTVERAQRLYDRGQSAEALTLVEQARQRAPGDPEARFLQGLIFADMGRNADAIEVFAALTADYPELPEPWNNLAVLFAENGEFDKARQALLAAIQTHPSYSTAHENLGDLYARMAGMAYDRALEQDRGNESARLKLSAVNGLFSVPAVATTQVASVEPPDPEPVRQPDPEPVQQPEPEPAVQPKPEPVVQPEPEPVQPELEPEPVQVATAEPVSEPPTTAVADHAGAVVSAVNNWAAAWSSQDVDGYLNSYARSFRPANGASRASWVRYRRDRLTKPSFVQVDVSNINVQVLDESTAVATFTQLYRSDNYEDQVVKTLSMALTDAGWQITGEVSDSG